MLRPSNNIGLTIKSVTHDVARLLLDLENAAPLPHRFVDALGSKCDNFVARMVLDEILQIKVGGEMLCGPAAIHVVSPMEEAAMPAGCIAALSNRALQYAERLAVANVGELSEQLYSYNRIPVSPRWLRRFPHRTAVSSYLGLDRDPVATLLHTSWIEITTQAYGRWSVWQSRRNAAPIGGAIYKLYVSAACTTMGYAMGSAVEAASRFRAFQWKVGADIQGLLRPDKLILYFVDFDDLRTAAGYLLQELKGCSSHGVPFTAELESDGLLSWGIDPPSEKSSAPWLKLESWRVRICNRLASSLVLAKNRPVNSISPSRFALQRLRLDGIDTDTWVPF